MGLDWFCPPTWGRKSVFCFLPWVCWHAGWRDWPVQGQGTPQQSWTQRLSPKLSSYPIPLSPCPAISHGWDDLLHTKREPWMRAGSLRNLSSLPHSCSFIFFLPGLAVNSWRALHPQPFKVELDTRGGDEPLEVELCRRKTVERDCTGKGDNFVWAGLVPDSHCHCDHDLGKNSPQATLMSLVHLISNSQITKAIIDHVQEKLRRWMNKNFEILDHQ